MSNKLDICKINFTFGTINLTIMKIAIFLPLILFISSICSASSTFKLNNLYCLDSITFKAEKISQTDSIVLNGNIKKVFPLFGAFEEGKWSKGWNPTIIYMSRDTIEEGTTFKTKSHGFGEPDFTWRINKYDPNTPLIQYLIMSPNRYWTITVECDKLADDKTLARITYSFIGLNEMGNHLDEAFIHRIYAQHLQDWAQEINLFLAKNTTGNSKQ